MHYTSDLYIWVCRLSMHMRYLAESKEIDNIVGVLFTVVKLACSTVSLTGDRVRGDDSKQYQRTNGPVNAHLISWPSKAQNIQNLENI